MSNVLETPLNPDELAQSMIVELRRIASRGDGFMFLPVQRRKKLAPVAALSDEFLEVVAAAFDTIPELAVSCRMTSAQVRAIIARTRAMETVAKEEDLRARGHRDSIALQRSEAGYAGLRAYELAKRMNIESHDEQVVPYITAMREALGRRGPKKMTPAEKAKLAETRAALKAARIVEEAKAASAALAPEKET